jgi:hypothetical protein
MELGHGSFVIKTEYSKWWFCFYTSDRLNEFRDAKLRRNVAASQRLRMPLSDAELIKEPLAQQLRQVCD